MDIIIVAFNKAKVLKVIKGNLLFIKLASLIINALVFYGHKSISELEG